LIQNNQRTAISVWSAFRSASNQCAATFPWTVNLAQGRRSLWLFV